MYKKFTLSKRVENLKMCGRYTLYKNLNLDFQIPNNLMGKNYNITPYTRVPVVLKNGQVKLIQWTFKVSWLPKLSLINARSETLKTKKIFQNTKRCIFIANGYFEWLKKIKVKIPFYHTFENEMMYFGGIYNETGACIVTRESYALRVTVHHRQPVILRYHEFQNWFDLKHDYCCRHSKNMLVYQVSNKVNISKNNSADNIRRIAGI